MSLISNPLILNLRIQLIFILKSSLKNQSNVNFKRENAIFELIK